VEGFTDPRKIRPAAPVEEPENCIMIKILTACQIWYSASCCGSCVSI